MDDLSDRLRRIESVSNLRPYGVQQEQISVYADHARLAAYGIGEKTLSAALAAQGLTPLGGSVSNAETETPIHIAPSLAGGAGRSPSRSSGAIPKGTSCG